MTCIMELRYIMRSSQQQKVHVSQMLRLMASAYLKAGNAALALQCVQSERMLPPRLSEHHSVPYHALQALLQLDRIQDAEGELHAVISHQVSTCWLAHMAF